MPWTGSPVRNVTFGLATLTALSEICELEREFVQEGLGEVWLLENFLR